MEERGKKNVCEIIISMRAKYYEGGTEERHQISLVYIRVLCVWSMECYKQVYLCILKYLLFFCTDSFQSK